MISVQELDSIIEAYNEDDKKYVLVEHIGLIKIRKTDGIYYVETEDFYSDGFDNLSQALASVIIRHLAETGIPNVDIAKKITDIFFS